MPDAQPWWDYPRSPTGVKTLAAMGVSEGLAIDQVLAGTHLTAEQIDSADTLVSAEQELSVARNLVVLLGDLPGLGAGAGKDWTLGGTSILGFTMLASATFRQALEFGIRYVELSWMFHRPRLESHVTHGSLILDGAEVPEGLSGLLFERDLVALGGFLPVVLGTELTDTRVVLPRTLAPKRRDAVAEQLPGLPVELDVWGGFAIANDVLDTPLPSADPVMAELCSRKCEEHRSIRQRQHSTSSMVRAMLLRDPAQMPSMNDVARQLHLDPRTLHRRLRAERTSFRALESAVRASIAVDFLQSTQLTVTEVGRRLGYSEAAAFSRAFKRWTGLPPNAYRQAADGEAAP